MQQIKEKIETIKDSGGELKREIREKTLGYILTSFGLVAGLAWNEAIKGLIDRFFSDTGNGLRAKFLYAIVTTIFVVIISFYFSRLLKVEKGGKTEKVEMKTPEKKK
jgi:hypothetical protein